MFELASVWLIRVWRELAGGIPGDLLRFAVVGHGHRSPEVPWKPRGRAPEHWVMLSKAKRVFLFLPTPHLSSKEGRSKASPRIPLQRSRLGCAIG